MPAPTFLCIGAQKCGTTWLARAVQQHPEVVPGKKKELHFFNHEEAYARGLDFYESQFRRRRAATRAVGEFTPNYWWTEGTRTSFHLPGSADRVAEAYPDLRLLVCLRDPLDRAVSAYFHHMRAGRYGPSLPLRDAVRRYPDIREFGLYATQLEAWQRRFPADRFLVLVYEEQIAPDAAKALTLRRVFEHIGVDPDFVPEGLTVARNVRTSDYEVRVRHAPPAARRLLRQLPARAQEWSMWRIKVAAEDTAALREEFRAEVDRLQTLLARPLPWRLGAALPAAEA